MKTSRCFFLLLLLTGSFASKVQSQLGSHGQFAFFPGAESRTLAPDQFFSPNQVKPESYHLLADRPASSHHLNASSQQNVAMTRFLIWVYEWFLVGKYVAYYPHKFVYLLPRNMPDKKPSQKIKADSKSARVSKKKPKKYNAKKTPQVPAKDVVEPPSDVIPEEYQALVSSVTKHGISFKDLTTDKKPDDFPSKWVWLVIGWVDNALKQAQEQYYLDYSLDDVLANTDPALPAIVRGTLRAALFVEDKDPGELGGEYFNNQHVALTIGWMDYMFLLYNCPLDWRTWLISKPEFSKGSLLQSNSEDLITFDTSDDGSRAIARKLKLSESHLNRMSRPRLFRSTSLWIIIEEFYSDDLHCLDASSFQSIFPADLIFADTVSSVLYEIFSAKSALNKKELYLMEYWVDLAVERLQTQTRTRTLLEWRNSMTLAPNNLQYFVGHSPMDESEQSSLSLSSKETSTPLVSTVVTHRHAFEESTLSNRALFDLDSKDDQDSEDSDNDYEKDGGGY